jgi:hypothetical protein
MARLPNQPLAWLKQAGRWPLAWLKQEWPLMAVAGLLAWLEQEWP